MNDVPQAQDPVVAVHVIGSIHSPFVAALGTPIQPAYARGSVGEVVVADRYAEALEDIEGFERVWLACWMDRAHGYRARVTPDRDVREHGVLATRSPSRPNLLGLSAVRMLSRDGCRLRVGDLDVLDGTPRLDLKPCVPDFDSHPGARAGWFEIAGVDRALAGDRFHQRSHDEDPVRV